MASVRKRNCVGKAGATVEVWVVDYKDAEGRRRLHTPRPNSKSAADKVARMIAKNPHLTRRLTKYTVRDICRQYLMVLEQRLADGDRMSQTRLTRQWRLVYKVILPRLGDVVAEDLSPMQVQAWADELRSKRVGKSVGVVREALMALGGALTEAQRLEIITRNVVKTAPPRLPPVKQASIQVPSREDIRKLLAAAEGRIKLMVEIAIFTGMRVGEIRALMWPQVDFERKCIRVKHSAEPNGNIKSPKTKSGVRDVPMSPRVEASLRHWHSITPRRAHGLLFPSPARSRQNQRQAIVYHSIATEWSKLKEKAQVDPGLNFHSLRHAAASLYIETGLSAQRLKVLMGHASITMTFDRYGYLFPDDGAAQLASAQIETNLLNGLEAAASATTA